MALIKERVFPWNTGEIYRQSPIFSSVTKFGGIESVVFSDAFNVLPRVRFNAITLPFFENKPN